MIINVEKKMILVDLERFVRFLAAGDSIHFWTFRSL